jgi:hypothetical protein
MQQHRDGWFSIRSRRTAHHFCRGATGRCLIENAIQGEDAPWANARILRFLIFINEPLRTIKSSGGAI